MQTVNFRMWFQGGVVMLCIKVARCFAHTPSSPSPPADTYQVLLQWSAGTALMCIF